MGERCAVQTAAQAYAALGQILRRLVAVYSRNAQGKDTALSALLSGKKLNFPGISEQKNGIVKQLPLSPYDLCRAPLRDILHSGKQSRNTGHIVCACLKTIRQIIRHLLHKTVRTRAAGEKRFWQ